MPPNILLPLAVGTTVGAGIDAGLPFAASGFRKGMRPHFQAALVKKQVGPLGTVADLGPNQFKFASAENSPMHRQILDEVYVARAQGHLDETEVGQLEAFSAYLQKDASFGDAFRVGLGTAAASAVGGLAVMGMSHGIQSAYDSMTFEKDLQATLKVRPELSNYPKEQVRLVYQSLRRLSPEVAKDPLTASTYLVRQFERRNPSDPHSLPTVELETARTLTSLTGELGKRRDAVRDALLDANRAGVQAGSEYMRDQRARKNMHDMETLKYERSRLLETHKGEEKTNTEIRKENRDAARANLAAQHAQGMGELTQKLQEMQNKLNAAEARADNMERRTGSDIARLMRSPTTTAAFGVRTSLPMTTRKKK